MKNSKCFVLAISILIQGCESTTKLDSMTTLVLEDIDKYQANITSQLDNKDYAGVRKTIDDYEYLLILDESQAQGGFKMPPKIVFIRAYTHYQLNDYKGAKKYIEQYLAVIDKNTPEYNKAIKMQSAISNKVAKDNISKIQNAISNYESSYVKIRPGQFMMGVESESSIFGVSALPRHKVQIEDSFYINKTLVPHVLYELCVADGECKNKLMVRDSSEDVYYTDYNSHVLYASLDWDTITKTFIPWIDRKTSATHRLPTEAEWEYMCKTGSTDEELKQISPRPFYQNNIGISLSTAHYVSEVLQDCKHADYINAPTDGSAWLVKDGGGCSERIVRGFYSSSNLWEYCTERSTFQKSSYVSFRLIRE